MEAQAWPQNIHPTQMLRTRAKTDSVPANKLLMGPSYDVLMKKLLDRSALIGVVGLGYVGLPLAVNFNKGGFKVAGFDKISEKVDLLNGGTSYIQDVSTADVSSFVKSQALSATTDFSELENCDVVVVCVPTPLAKTKDPDMSYILSALADIGASFREGQLIILESTTYPGTTREVMLPELERFASAKLGRKAECGKDFFLAFSPERVDPGNEKYNTYNTPKVVGGVTEACGDLSSVFYSRVMEKVVRVTSPESAEMVKLLENTFRAVNIGLVNEVSIMCEKLGVDCWEVIEAASTKPFGFMPFYPGPGLGGHCIPIDPTYLSWKLKTLNYHARFIELATTINSSMPSFCIDRVAEILNSHKKPINGSKILILGVAYKKDIDDVRESPSLDLIHMLKKRGAFVDYYDSFIPKISHDGISMQTQEWSQDLVSKYDIVIIATDHSDVDYAAVVKGSEAIFDSRNALKNFEDPKISKL